MDKNDLQDYYLFSVGVMVQQATVTDGFLCSTFKLLTSVDQNLAEAIFYTFDAFPTRKNLLLRVLTAIKADPETADLVNEILHGVEKCNNKRTELAHSTISYTADHKGPVQVRAKLQTRQHKPITRAYIDSVLSEASRATQKAWRAYEALTKKLLVQP